MKIAVIIPSFKVEKFILDLLKLIGPEVHAIYVVDDCCPNGSGRLVRGQCTDPRVHVLFHEVNQGVGGATITGYLEAMKDNCEILLKIDGDGQMDPVLIKNFISPILNGDADYAKGNRFFDLEEVSQMPLARIVGNAGLSFMNKLSTGYWDVFDPTNGYTAIHRGVAQYIPFHKISKRYFFETDVLFRLNTLRARVVDIPMDAKYGEEASNLRISKVLPEFLWKHGVNFIKRIFYTYYLRGMSLASLELPLGVGLMTFGLVFGIYHWVLNEIQNTGTPTGTIMLATISIIVGIHFVFAFLAYDIAQVPQIPFQKLSNRIRYKLKRDV